MDTITIERRFRGPARSGNGGYVCGRLASFIDGPATVRLQAPPPLDVPLEIHDDGSRVTMKQGERVLGIASPAELDVTAPPLPSDAVIQACQEAYLAEADKHVLPHCFVCGPRRDEGDGLRLFAGLTPDRKMAASAWRPTRDLADAEGRVRAEFLWAALDCPSYFSLGLMGELALLASLSAKIDRRPKADEPLTVIAWPSHNDGRKHFAYSAIVGEDGTPVAVGHALWIEVTDQELRKTLLADNR